MSSEHNNQVEKTNNTINSSSKDYQTLMEIDSVSVEYKSQRGKIKALRDISIDINSGETLGVAGESGSGKSTLALAILQYLPENGQVTNGEINFKGDSLTARDKKELRSIRGKEIAHVAQDPESALNPSISVGEQIRETISLHQNVSKQEAKKRTIEILDKTEISDPEYNYQKYPHELSGGMQQRVVIAMALSCNPDLLILDEPTTGLDVTTQSKILSLINDLKSNYDASILVISHNLAVISEIADRVGILYAGELMEIGGVGEVFINPSNPYTQGLLASTPELDQSKKLTSIPGKLPDLIDIPDGCVFADRCEFSEASCRESGITFETVDDTTGHKTRCRRWETARENPIKAETSSERNFTPGEKLLEVRNITKYYETDTFMSKFINSEPPVKAVDGVSFDIDESEATALVGESGCGKSTLGNVLIGLVEATSGTISFDGNPLKEMSSKEMRHFRSECQIVFQNPDSSLNPRKTVGTILKRPIELFSEKSKKEIDNRVVELLNQVQLSEDYIDRYPHELSGGEKQRISIARAFAANPSFIILDEPVSSLDVSVKASILNLLSDLREEYKTSYLLISHDLSAVQHIADRVMVMYLGEIVESGPTETIFNNPKHPYTEVLLESIPILNSPDEQKSTYKLKGDVPSARDPPSGCRFHTRCPYSREACTSQSPDKISGNKDNHMAACFRELPDHPYWETETLEHAESNQDSN